MMKKTGGLNALSLLHKAMLLGQVIFIVISVFIVYLKIMDSPLKEMDKNFQLIAIVIAAAGFFSGSVLFKKKLEQINGMKVSVKEKFEVYHSASIIKWALLEGPCLITVFFFIVTGNYAFLALSTAQLILFTIEFPVKMKIALQLGINESELDDL